MYNNFKAAPNLGNRGKINEFFRVLRRQDLLSIVLSIVVCFPGPDVIKKILCRARLLAVGIMGCRSNGLSA
jgi:hypothetical protein